uniref:Uncharacterized protein n=1 Tax=Panagrolaimus superbus TaxID=310955 RepID=A0A914YPB5_9BILA
MVIAVAAYVIIGAWAIRSIEATPRTSEFDAGYATKEERLQIARQQMLQKNQTFSRPPQPQKRSETILPRVKRKAALLRSRRCVVIALRKLAETAKCEKSSLTKDLMFELDECYEEDIKNLITQAKDDAAAAQLSLNSPIPLPPPSPKEAEKEAAAAEVEWVYWSMTDAILFCFTVITTIGKSF